MTEVDEKIPAEVGIVEDMDVEITRPSDNLSLHFYRTELNKTFFEIPNHYEQLLAVGVGAYGAVISAFDTVRQERVAVKKLNRPFQTAIHAKRTYREIKLLKHMNHENVIGLLDLFTPQMNVQSLNNFRDVYLVNELMGADLNQIIKSQKLSDDHVQFLVYQLLRGLKYIHSVGVIHRDLKPSNIAVNEDCGLKILDFGLARQHDEEMTGYVATRWYRAPEIMLNWMHYGESVDIWSAGCIMSELITRKPLFPGNDHIDQLTLILKVVGTPDDSFLERIPFEDARQFIRQLPRFPRKSFKDVYPTASAAAVDLLEKMLDLDPESRISAVKTLEHPYLEQYHDEEDEPTGEKFDSWFEDKELTVDEWKKLVLDEIKSFAPPAPPQAEEE